MAQTYLIFEFGANEDLAQEARHRLEGWKQGFRLGKKLELKFERSEAADQPDEQESSSKKEPKKKSGGKASSGKEEKTGQKEITELVRLIVRLDFSEHEKLSLQRWLDRIPTEEPFKSAKCEIIRPGDKDFAKTAELFEIERNYSSR